LIVHPYCHRLNSSTLFQFRPITDSIRVVVRVPGVVVELRPLADPVQTIRLRLFGKAQRRGTDVFCYLEESCDGLRRGG
jgi:hypothetical protein